MRGKSFSTLKITWNTAKWNSLVTTHRESQTSQQTPVALVETVKAKPTFDISGILCQTRLQKRTSMYPLQATERGNACGCQPDVSDHINVFLK